MPTTRYAEGFGATYRPADALNAQGSVGRELRFADFVYTMLGTEVATDVIQLGYNMWPKGTEVAPEFSRVYVETDCAVTLTLDVGDLDASAALAAYDDGDAFAVAHIANDADRYADGLDIGAVGVDAFASGVAAGIPHKLQSDAYLTATFATLSTPAANGKLRIRVAYFPA